MTNNNFKESFQSCTLKRQQQLQVHGSWHVMNKEDIASAWQEEASHFFDAWSDKPLPSNNISILCQFKDANDNTCDLHVTSSIPLIYTVSQKCIDITSVTRICTVGFYWFLAQMFSRQMKDGIISHLTWLPCKTDYGITLEIHTIAWV